MISNERRNLFIPVNKPSGVLAYDSTAGLPSKTITRSARYVAMIYLSAIHRKGVKRGHTKSCSTTKAVLLELMTNFLITLLAWIRCSESRYAEGSSMSKTSAGTPSTRQMATRCSSPPDRLWVRYGQEGFRQDLRLDILVNNGLDLHWLDDVRVELGVCLSVWCTRIRRRGHTHEHGLDPLE